MFYWKISLVEFIRNYIRGPSGVFSISSPVRILMTSFPAFFTIVCVNSRWKMASDKIGYIIKRKLHGGLKIWILFFRVKTIFYHSKIKFISSRRRVISFIYFQTITLSFSRNTKDPIPWCTWDIFRTSHVEPYYKKANSLFLKARANIGACHV